MDYDWGEFKYKRLPKFCYYCGKLTLQSRLCNVANNVCIGFVEKYAQFGERLHWDMNMKVPMHVKSGGLNRKKVEGFVFGSNNDCDKKKGSVKGCWLGQRKLGLWF